jgi:hypothetical protein
MRRCAPPAALALLGALLAACSGETPEPAIDAAPVRPDGAEEPPGPTVLAVNFTVIGCPSFDATVPQCRGPAPLTLTFVPITSGPVTRFLWDFGDRSTSFETLPSHTYPFPDTYDVSLLGAPALVMREHKQFVVVNRNPLGGPCDVERQCEIGLSCLCGLASPASSQCPPTFARGLCTQACPGMSCAENAFCADLNFEADPSLPPGSWRGRYCLRRCAVDRDCDTDQSCRALPTAGAPEIWERACFYRFPAELGSACRGATGEPQKDLCLSGLCAELGALGICSLDCASRACPAGTTCASFGDGRKLCLQPCTSQESCRNDPLLACAPPGRPGPLGWRGPEAAGAAPGAPGTLCAPKPCDTDEPCAPAGICLGEPGASHCVRRAGGAPPSMGSGTSTAARSSAGR